MKSGSAEAREAVRERGPMVKPSRPVVQAAPAPNTAFADALKAKFGR